MRDIDQNLYKGAKQTHAHFTIKRIRYFIPCFSTVPKLVIALFFVVILDYTKNQFEFT